MNDKEEAYRRFIRGDVSEVEVRNVFGDHFEEFTERRELVDLMTETPNKEPSDDLFETTP